MKPDQDTSQEAFKREVEEKNRHMDVHLDVISKGMEELRHYATVIGSELDTQQADLQLVNIKIEETTHTTNRLNRLLDALGVSNCPIEAWCCVIFLTVLLLAIIGYVLSRV